MELNQILNNVQKPGRYIGGETNSVLKEFADDKVSVVLAYPDTYEVGMSYLGLRVLYHLINERDDMLCERVFMPWSDMEKELKDNDLKLFSLESKTDINKFDILGFSLSYELTYTNVLSILQLGRITIESDKRRDDEPLVIAGGACCYNPEPMSKFIDLFIIGDGEEILPDFVDAYREIRKNVNKRKEILKALVKLKGVYVPSFYTPEHDGEKFLRLKPLDNSIPEVIEKNTLSGFESAYYPVKQIVPLVKIIHDRIAVEIMRGCPNRCRFCQASVVNGPVRLRSPAKIREICRETYKNTGYETIALLSLSSVNYPHLVKLVRGLKEDLSEEGIGISVPSLRIDESFYDIPEVLASMRKTGLTFAPESASNVTRKALGKDIDLNILCKSASLAFQHGWRRLKLYFMVGFPSDPQDEVENIIKLARELSGLKRKVSKGAAEIKVSINPFVPKTHTPLQWLGMKKKEELLSIKQKLIAASSKKVKFEMHNINQTILEACISRGDRRIGDVIHTAWLNGAKMDSWREFFNFTIWEESFKQNGLDIHDYACKTYEIEDALPWDHIKTQVSKERLIKEFKASGMCD